MRILARRRSPSPSPRPAGAATRNFGIDSFDKIRVDGPYTVT